MSNHSHSMSQNSPLGGRKQNASQKASRLVWSGKTLGGALLILAVAFGLSTSGQAKAPKEPKPAKAPKVDKALEQIVAKGDNSGSSNIPVIVTYKAGAEEKVQEKVNKHGKGV